MKKIAAVIAVIGAIDSPIIYFAANLWQEAHPVTELGPLAESDSSFGADYGITLLVSVIAFTLLFVLLYKYPIQNHGELENLKRKNCHEKKYFYTHFCTIVFHIV